MMKNKDATLSSQKPESGNSLSKNKEIKKLLDMGVQRGYLSYEEVNELMPPDMITPESIDEVMNLLSESEIEVIDSAKRPKESDDEEEEREHQLVSE
jgi:RNA polymerase primary sigma factor